MFGLDEHSDMDGIQIFCAKFKPIDISDTCDSGTLMKLKMSDLY
jgi:hypothetical protein